jgi:hypothetical protein
MPLPSKAILASLTFLLPVGLCSFSAVPALAAEQCKLRSCVTVTATKTGTGWDVHVKLRPNGHPEYYNVLIPGHQQIEIDGPGNNAALTRPVSADWNGIVAVQACNTNPPIGSNCDSWSNFQADMPKAMPALSTPNDEFCNWYAAEAVARAGQGAKCGLTGARWDPNKQAHYDWCIQQKSQQQGWSEHNARLGALADCAKKEVAAAPPKSNFSVGAAEFIVKQDVDIYKEPGGSGQPFDILRRNTKVGVYERRADQWCFVAGKGVPQERGWVWCGEGFELQ